jgi:4a-hydroxytetrahydrobiopterin dehydratase
MITDTAAPTPLAERRPARGPAPHWQVVRIDGRSRLTTSLPFRDFTTALGFAHRVGLVANEMDHHPDLHVSWGHLGIDVWTHSAGGLTELDFIFAARVDRLAPEAPGLLPESGR